MSGISRRSWLKKASLGSGLAAIGSTGIISSLSAEEIKKYNPRPIDGPIRLGSNENPYGPSESRFSENDRPERGCS
jgi:hypothetical protein